MIRIMIKQKWVDRLFARIISVLIQGLILMIISEIRRFTFETLIACHSLYFTAGIYGLSFVINWLKVFLNLIPLLNLMKLSGVEIKEEINKWSLSCRCHLSWIKLVIWINKERWWEISFLFSIWLTCKSMIRAFRIFVRTLVATFQIAADFISMLSHTLYNLIWRKQGIQ